MPVYPIKIILQIAVVCHLMIYGCFCLFVVALLLLLDYFFLSSFFLGGGGGGGATTFMF